MKHILCLLVLAFVASVQGFAPTQRSVKVGVSLSAADGDADPNEIVARRILVKGDVQGGYYRTCVKNEAERFRKLIGTMSPPDDTDSAEIYVEGKRKMVDGFIRWCTRGDVGLSQQATVSDVKEEDPTGLFEGFYVKTQ